METDNPTRMGVAKKALDILNNTSDRHLAIEERVNLATAYAWVGDLLPEVDADEGPGYGREGSTVYRFARAIDGIHVDVGADDLALLMVRALAEDTAELWARVGAAVADQWSRAYDAETPRQMRVKDMQDRPGWD